MNTNNKTHNGGTKTMCILTTLLATLTTTLALTTTAHATSEPPTIEVKEAAEITRTSMKVCGTINPHGQATTYHFDYDYLIGEKYFEKSTTDASVGESEAPVEVCVTLTELPPNKVIIYSLQATNAEGTSVGYSLYPSTAPAIEGLEIGPVTEVSAHAAVLHGSFEPNGFDTHYYFHCYDGENVLVPAAAPGVDAGSAAERKEVQASIGGVGGNSEVSCKLVVANSFGSEETKPVSFTTEKAAPEITRPITSKQITASSAVADGRIMTQNELTTYWVEYVEAAKYEPEAANPYAAGQVGPPGELRGQNGIDSAIDVPMENLLPQTMYHYRLVFKNGTGESVGPDVTVTTGALTPPIVSTGGAGNISATTATIFGTVNAQGAPTSYEFQIGTDTTYGGAEIFGGGGEGEGTETVRTTLEYLVPGTTYHYRIIATSKDGTVYGADRTFTTPDVPSPISQPASTPLLSFTTIRFPTAQKAQLVKKKNKKKSKPKHKHRKVKHGKKK